MSLACFVNSFHSCVVSIVDLPFSLSLSFSFSLNNVNSAPIVKEMEKGKETDDETSFEICNLPRPSRRLFKG